MIERAKARSQVKRLSMLLGFPRDSEEAMTDLIDAVQCAATDKQAEDCIAAFLDTSEADSRCPSLAPGASPMDLRSSGRQQAARGGMSALQGNWVLDRGARRADGREGLRMPEDDRMTEQFLAQHEARRKARQGYENHQVGRHGR